MPEAPDLEIIKDFLNRKVQGTVVKSAKVIRPTVLRSISGDFASDIQAGPSACSNGKESSF